jgi:hypothetical protein
MRATIICSFLVVLIGCGGSSSSDQKPDVSTTQDNICDQVAQVACFDYFQCCSEGEIQTILNVRDSPTRAQCEDDTRTMCERSLATLEFSVNDKHINFDASSMNGCLQAFVAPDGMCAAVVDKLPWIDACMDAGFVGAVQPGGTCDFPNECVKDAFCDGNQTCKALLTAGMACTSSTACASGLYCPASPTPTCTPKLAKDAACTGAGQCMDGLFCDLETTQTCVAQHAIGQACGSNEQCLSNDCVPGTCADGSNLSCSDSTGCNSHCTNDPATGCLIDDDCNVGVNGMCSGTGATCSSATPCPVGSTCVFPNKCARAECMGTACVAPHIVVDYCQGVNAALPIVLGQGLTPGQGS